MVYRASTVVVVLLLAGFVVGAGCAGKAPQPTPFTPTFDEARAWADLEAQLAFGPRVPGTAAQTAARDWLVARLKECSSDVTTQHFTHQIGEKKLDMWNILATFAGTGEAPREQVLLSAHWDSRPTADHDPDPNKRMLPIPGANDGASGVAVLLEVARQLKERPVGRDVVIALWDGEDYGTYPNMATNLDHMLLGAKHYAANLPARKPDWGILLDMIGDKDLTVYREPNSEERAKAVNDRVFGAARELGYLKATQAPGFMDSLFYSAITDDHIPLNDAGIPTVDLIDFTYPPWHTHGDTADKCSADSLRVVGMTVLYAIQMR